MDSMVMEDDDIDERSVGVTVMKDERIGGSVKIQ